MPSVKVKPVRALPLRGAKGRFIKKSKVKGKAKINQFFAVIKDSMLEVARAEVRGIAEGMADEIRRRIAYQTVAPMGGRKFGMSRRFDRPLHPFTVKEKATRGRDARTMISTGFYVNHIGVVAVKKGKGWSYRVGFTKKEHPSGISMDKLGRIQEYGAKIKVTDKMRRYLHWRGLHLRKETEFIVIPARPHWGPTLTKLKRELKEITKWASKNIAVELKKKLKTL